MAFWKPGTVAPGSSIDRDSDSTALEGGAGAGAGAVTGRVQQVAVSERRNRLPIAKQRASLPLGSPPPLAPRLTSLTLALLPTLGRRRRPPLPPRAAPRRRPPVPDRHGQEHPAPAVPPRGRLGKGGQEHRRHAAPTVRPSPSCKLSQVYVELTRGSVHAESPPSRSRSVSQKRSAASSATRCALRLPPNLPARASFVS